MSDYKMKKANYSNIDKNINIVFISAEFNRNYTKLLEDINEKSLNENGFTNIKKYLIPGAFEIPAFLKKVILNTSPDLIFCFGVVIRGATTHYDMVAGESSRGIMNISLEKNSPAIINAILTCENTKQVEERLESSYAISGLNLLSEIKSIQG